MDSYLDIFESACVTSFKIRAYLFCYDGLQEKPQKKGKGL